MSEEGGRLSLGVLDKASESRIFRELALIGKGAYGDVYSAEWVSERKRVALKVFKSSVNGEKGISATALREIAILNKLRSHRCDALVSLLHSFSRADDTLVCVYEWCETDLSKLLRSRNNHHSSDDGSLSWHEKWPLMTDITQGVCFLHSLKLAHRDLKPQNILITSEGRAKIADFGLARPVTVAGQTWTKQVQTLWYRAPELLFGIKRYLFEIDMWSLGVVLAEIISGSSLFSANSEVGVLMKIMHTRGTPSIETWPECRSLPYFSEMFPRFIGQDLSSVIKMDDNHSTDCASEVRSQMVDLIDHLLMMNPRHRWNYRDVIRCGLFHHRSSSSSSKSAQKRSSSK